MAQKSCLSSYINLYLHIVFIIKTKGTYSEAETEKEQSPLLLAESTTSSSIYQSWDNATGIHTTDTWKYAV